MATAPSTPRLIATPPFSLFAAGVIPVGLAAGVLAACGYTLPALLLLSGAALVWAGSRLQWITIQTILLASLLFVPDGASGKTFGLLVTWSAGLTWSNFVVPGLALPLLAGAWWSGKWSGKQVWPTPCPGLACWMLVLLGWSLLVLFTVSLSPGLHLSAPDALSILAHAAKLALFILLGLALLRGGSRWRRRAECLLLAAIALNAAVGLAQAGGWVAALSPLAQGPQPRATGLFYDANLYAVATSWALLWLLAQSPAQRAWRRRAGYALALVVAGSLVAAASRAGYVALLAGCAVLWWAGHRRAVLHALLLLGILLLLFPAQGWQRMRAAAHADASTLDRLDSMGEALLQIRAHPLLGLGFGRALYLGVPTLAPGPVQPPLVFRGAQDMFLTVWAASGPIGLALLLLAALAPWRLLDRQRRYALAPVLAGYAGVLTACLTQEALWNARLLAVVVLLTAGSEIGWRRAS